MHSLFKFSLHMRISWRQLKRMLIVSVGFLLCLSYLTYIRADITTTGRKGVKEATKIKNFDSTCDNYPMNPGFVYIQPFTAPKLDSVYNDKEWMAHKGIAGVTENDILYGTKEELDEKFKNVSYNPFQQYRVLRLAGALQVPSMTEDAIIFVPDAATKKTKSLYDGWLKKKTKKWYSSVKAIFDDPRHMNNMIFYCANNKGRSIDDINKNGIYRKRLRELLLTKESYTQVKNGKKETITIEVVKDNLKKFNQSDINKIIRGWDQKEKKYDDSLREEENIFGHILLILS